MKFILASASPRRRELLKSINLNFEIITTDIEEKLKENIHPDILPIKLSEAKALDVARNVSYNEECLVIGADTIVKIDNEIFGKPHNEDEAIMMLNKLSGRCHEVITGVTIVRLPDFKVISDKEVTKVYFKELSQTEINSYIKTKEYCGKAGAYAIQGYGSLLVKQIEGCYPNIVGLPISKLNDMMDNFNVNLFGWINK